MKNSSTFKGGQYLNYYDENLKIGQEYENKIIEFLNQQYYLGILNYKTQEEQIKYGETNIGIEIKFDMKSEETKNLYFEYAEKSNPNNSKYVKSGFLREDNSKYYLIGNSSNFYIFKKEDLKKIYEKYKDSEDLKVQEKFKSIKTSKGYVIEITSLNKNFWKDKFLKFSFKEIDNNPPNGKVKEFLNLEHIIKKNNFPTPY